MRELGKVPSANWQIPNKMKKGHKFMACNNLVFSFGPTF
jgi:hypothetical protein